MTEKIYTTRKKVILADGTVKEYTSTYKYQKKKTVTHKPAIDLIKKINNQEDLDRVIEFITQNINGISENDQI